MSFIASLFGGGKSSAPPPPPPPPQAPSPEKSQEGADEAMRKKRASMAKDSKTTYTSPLGSGAQASVAVKTLLGQ